MAIELRRASSLPGAMMILLLLLFLHTPTSTGKAHIHGYKNPSFRQNAYLSEWGLESENGRRLLQTSNYIVYNVLDPDRSYEGDPTPGNAYKPGCQANYYCRQ